LEHFFIEIGVATTVFAGTNIDDIFVLLAFFSDRRFKTSEVVIGQYLGILALLIVSFALAFGAKAIPGEYIGFLGLVPFALGLKKLYELRKKEDQDHEISPEKIGFGRSYKVFKVAGVTIANGGDNLGVYTPLFATKSMSECIIFLVVFALLTAVWCAVGFFLLKHRTIGDALRRYAHFVVPWVFIGLGILILYEAGTFQLLGISS
jgi:cadmium resistance transport/sequestration family protein